MRLGLSPDAPAPVTGKAHAMPAQSPHLAADAERLARLHAGDDGAFETLYMRYRGELTSYAQRRLKGYLYRAVHKGCLDALRGKAVSCGELVDEPVGGDDPAAGALRREAFREVLGDVARLPERQRGALVAVTMRDSSYAVTAGDMGTSTAAVKALVHRARRGLRGANGECPAVPGHVRAAV